MDLVKKDNLWRVKQRNDYPANFSEISGFLLKAADLKAAQTEEIGPSQLGRYKLLPPGPGTNTAVLVELRDQNGKVIKSLLLGKTHMRKSEGRPSPMGEMGENEGWPDGRYVMVGTGAKTVAVVSDPLSNLEAKPDQWLNKDFFKVEKIRSIAVAYPGGHELVEGDARHRNRQRLEAGRRQARASSSTPPRPPASPMPLVRRASTTSCPPTRSRSKPAWTSRPSSRSIPSTTSPTRSSSGRRPTTISPMVVAVTAQIPKERTPGKDEKPEDKARLDKEFKEKQKKLEDKLSQEKSLREMGLPGFQLDGGFAAQRPRPAPRREERGTEERREAGSADSSKKEEPPALPRSPSRTRRSDPRRRGRDRQPT